MTRSTQSLLAAATERRALLTRRLTLPIAHADFNRAHSEVKRLDKAIARLRDRKMRELAKAKAKKAKG
jgi:hypothetical protein